MRIWWGNGWGSRNKPPLKFAQAFDIEVSVCGARNGVRTRDLNLGKVALYQLSYSRFGRKVLVPRAGIEPARGHPHWILNPACLPVSPPRQRVEFPHPAIEFGIDRLSHRVTSAVP